MREPRLGRRPLAGGALASSEKGHGRRYLQGCTTESFPSHPHPDGPVSSAEQLQRLAEMGSLPETTETSQMESGGTGIRRVVICDVSFEETEKMEEKAVVLTGLTDRLFVLLKGERRYAMVVGQEVERGRYPGPMIQQYSPTCLGDFYSSQPPPRITYLEGTGFDTLISLLNRVFSPSSSTHTLCLSDTRVAINAALETASYSRRQDLLILQSYSKSMSLTHQFPTLQLLLGCARDANICSPTGRACRGF